MAPDAKLGSKNGSDRVGDFNSKSKNEDTELVKGVDDGLLSGSEIFRDVL